MSPTVIETFCEAFGASVTVVVPRVATTAAGPPRLRSKVSVSWPVFLTVIWNVLPGPAVDGLRLTLTPFLAIVSVPVAEPWTAGSVVDVAVALKVGLPDPVPGAGVRRRLTWRTL